MACSTLKRALAERFKAGDKVYVILADLGE